MVEVTIDSIRVSLMSQHRVVILKDVDSDRYLPIWIGPCEADAITVALQEVEVARPLTLDLMRSMLGELSADVVQINIHDLRDDVFFAQIVLNFGGKQLEIDSRPSDALGLAVRVHAPVFVDESVMEKASVLPDEDAEAEAAGEGDDRLSVFKDFVDSLDLDDMEPGEGEENK